MHVSLIQGRRTEARIETGTFRVVVRMLTANTETFGVYRLNIVF